MNENTDGWEIGRPGEADARRYWRPNDWLGHLHLAAGVYASTRSAERVSTQYGAPNDPVAMMDSMTIWEPHRQGGGRVASATPVECYRDSPRAVNAAIARAILHSGAAVVAFWLDKNAEGRWRVDTPSDECLEWLGGWMKEWAALGNGIPVVCWPERPVVNRERRQPGPPPEAIERRYQRSGVPAGLPGQSRPVHDIPEAPF